VRHVTALGYEFIPGLGEYKYHTEKRSWHKARDICQKEDAHLVIINSQREAEALLDLWKPHRHIRVLPFAHVGLYRHKVGEEYVSVLGKFPFLFTL
jgi:hypothetical protein